MCLLHLVASLPTNAERLHERTKRQQTGTLYWDILVKTKTTRKERRKTHKSTQYHLSKRGKIWKKIFRPNPEREGGARGGGEACRLWDQPMVREELEGKGIWRQIPLTIGSSVRDERRYDQRETSQKEPIPRQSNHLTICTRWQFLVNDRIEEPKQGKQKMTMEKWEFIFYP